jgi:branched-chain amino acid transport system substrate-binding protein
MRQRRRGWRLVVLVSVFALFAAACGDDDDDADTDTTDTTEGDGTTSTTGGDTTSTTAASSEGASVDGTLAFAAVLPQTGDLQPYGPGMLAAVELAVDDINAGGGVLGTDVTLQSDDSGTDPDIAGPAADSAVNTDNVDAIMGAAGSTETIQGVLPVTTAGARIACSGSATSPELTFFEDDGLFFRTAPSDEFQSRLLADRITGEGYSSVAIVNRADDYGQAFADLTQQVLEEAGAEVVASVPVDPEGTNFDADVEELVAAEPEAIVAILFPAEGGIILSAMIEAGIGPADLPIYATDGLADDTLGAAVNEADPTVVDGIIGTRPGATTEPTEFNSRLESEKGVTETTFAAQFYDCAIMTALGAVAADTDDPQAIAAELEGVTSGGTKCTEFAECAEMLAAGEDIDYDGITGFDLDEAGEPSEGVYEVWEFADGGTISSIETVTVTKDE